MAKTKDMFELNIKDQNEMVMLEVIAKEIIQKLNELVILYQCTKTEANEKNRQLLRLLLKTNSEAELKLNLNGKFVSQMKTIRHNFDYCYFFFKSFKGDLSRINENFIESMLKVVFNLSKLIMKCMDSSEKCVDYLKFIKENESGIQEIEIPGDEEKCRIL